MKHNYDEQIPDGMMERVSERLYLHKSIRKRRTKMATIMLVAFALLIPISAYSIGIYEGSWQRGIRIANEKGRTIPLNEVYDDGTNRIKFDNVIWEEDMLLISYTVETGNFIPRNYKLLDENYNFIDTGAGGRHIHPVNNSGALQLDIKNDILEEKIFLKVYSLFDYTKIHLQESSGDKLTDCDKVYTFPLNIDESFLEEGNSNINLSFKTKYGLFKINKIMNEKGKTQIAYEIELNEETKQILDTPDGFHLIDVLPSLFLKPKDGDILTGEESYAGRNEKGYDGIIIFDGIVENLEQLIAL
ncbi:hypothetical protein RBH29_15850, partial [Herbivorax sp. ANBcel31]|uniref:hypothetical protein n=1 Tax=Herbivorax sp. ANBcel31 TaxID=3069754 RepID=UPI0027B37131